jgi:hypothetical protein
VRQQISDREPIYLTSNLKHVMNKVVGVLRSHKRGMFSRKKSTKIQVSKSMLSHVSCANVGAYSQLDAHRVQAAMFPHHCALELRAALRLTFSLEDEYASQLIGSPVDAIVASGVGVVAPQWCREDALCHNGQSDAAMPYFARPSGSSQRTDGR